MTSIGTAIRSLSTSTPSQSKMTRSNMGSCRAGSARRRPPIERTVTVVSARAGCGTSRLDPHPETAGDSERAFVARIHERDDLREPERPEACPEGRTRALGRVAGAPRLAPQAPARPRRARASPATTPGGRGRRNPSIVAGRAARPRPTGRSRTSPSARRSVRTSRRTPRASCPSLRRGSESTSGCAFIVGEAVAVGVVAQRSRRSRSVWQLASVGIRRRLVTSDADARSTRDGRHRPHSARRRSDCSRAARGLRRRSATCPSRRAGTADRPRDAAAAAAPQGGHRGVPADRACSLPDAGASTVPSPRAASSAGAPRSSDGSLAPGAYHLISYQRPCDGNCGYLDPPTARCEASLELDAGTTRTVTVTLNDRGGCTVTSRATVA